MTKALPEQQDSDGLEPFERELGLLYNYTEDDSAQFTRWQMMVAIRHGHRLASEASAECAYCGQPLGEHEPSRCCGDGGGSTFETPQPEQQDSDRLVADIAWLRGEVRSSIGCIFPLAKGPERQARIDRIAAAIEAMSRQLVEAREALAIAESILTAVSAAGAGVALERIRKALEGSAP